MAAALSLAMPKEAFDAFLADTYGIDGLNKLEVADARCAATRGGTFWTEVCEAWGVEPKDRCFPDPQFPQGRALIILRNYVVPTYP